MQRDLLDEIASINIDTSLHQARSVIDGREYPVAPLSAEQIEELASCLGLAIDLRVAWALNDATRGAVRSLAAFFDELPQSVGAAYEAEREDVIKRIAVDPARALDDPMRSARQRRTMDTMLLLAKRRGIDPESRSGAVALGNLAAGMLNRKKPRIDEHFTIGEAQLFDAIIDIVAALAPEDMSLPSNDPTPPKPPDKKKKIRRQYPTVGFAEEFIVQVVDRAADSFPSDNNVQKRLYKLKARSFRSIVKALREARGRYRANPPLIVQTTQTEF